MKYSFLALLALAAASTKAFAPSAIGNKARLSLTEILSSSSSVDVPSMAQTHFQGPLAVNGSGHTLSKAELEQVRAELEDIKARYGLKEPDRAFMDDPDIKWRFGGKPDYSLTNLKFLKERSRMHPEGSLELIVENLVKTWEMERYVSKRLSTQELSFF